jgi:hypothetical protein
MKATDAASTRPRAALAARRARGSSTTRLRAAGPEAGRCPPRPGRTARPWGWRTGRRRRPGAPGAGPPPSGRRPGSWRSSRRGGRCGGTRTGSPTPHSRVLLGPGVTEATKVKPARPSGLLMAAVDRGRPGPVLYDLGMVPPGRGPAAREWVRAWKPVVAGVHEVFHAHFVDYAYPPHVHDAWTVFIVDDGWIRYDLERRHRGASPACGGRSAPSTRPWASPTTLWKRRCGWRATCASCGTPGGSTRPRWPRPAASSAPPRPTWSGPSPPPSGSPRTSTWWPGGSTPPAAATSTASRSPASPPPSASTTRPLHPPGQAPRRHPAGPLRAAHPGRGVAGATWWPGRGGCRRSRSAGRRAGAPGRRRRPSAGGSRRRRCARRRSARPRGCSGGRPTP